MFKTAPEKIKTHYPTFSMLPLHRNRQPRFRAARRRLLKAEGITPRNRQEIWGVKFVRGMIPPILEPYVIHGLADGGYVWLKRRGAKLALRMGWAREMIRTEFKRCLMCHRPLIGMEAESYRTLLELSPVAVPCGSRCEFERLSRLWDRLIA